MLKKVLIGIVVLVVVLAAATVAFVASFDANRYKPEIEKAALDLTGRALQIDGNLSLSIFPNLALTVPHLTLSERGSTQAFASLEHARVSVALLPLLAGRVEADTVSLVGLHATIRRHADGSTSVDDLTAASKTGPQAPAQGTRAPLPTLELGGLDIVDAAITLHDESDNSNLALSQVNLKIGRIAPNVATRAQASAALDLSQPPTHVDLKLSADAVAREGDRAHIEKLALDMKARQEDRAAALSVQGPASFDFAAGRMELPKFEGSVELDLPSLPQKTLKLALAGTLSIDTKPQHVRAQSTIRFDESVATLKADLEGFSQPHIVFEGTVDRLDIDRYLKTASTGASTAKSADHPAQANPSSDTKVDLSALKALHLDGRIALGALKGLGLKAADVHAAMRAAGGELEVAPVSAVLYQGKLSASLRAQAAGNRLALKGDLAGISVGPLLKDATGKEILDGHGNTDFDLATQGASIGAMRRALAGSAAIALRDGAVHGIDVAQRLRALRSAISTGSLQTASANPAEKTDFSELSAHFVVHDGVAVNHDLQLSSPLLRATGDGSIDVGALALDYTAKISVVGTLEGQGGEPLSELKGITVPLHISGPFENLAFGLDWRKVAQQALEQKAGEQLKSRLGTGAKPADILKGLLGH